MLPNQCENISLQPNQRLSFSVFIALVIFLSNIIAILICFSVTINKTEYFLLRLFAIFKTKIC